MHFCTTHQLLLLASEPCAQCAIEATLREILHAQSRRLDQQFDALMLLEARIADLEAKTLKQDTWLSVLSQRLRTVKTASKLLDERLEQLERTLSKAVDCIERLARFTQLV